MDHRNGTCSSCGATYKIPAAFEHDRARCKECGGTVAIGPVVSDAGGEKPPLEPYVPSGRKGAGPSMKEKLLAARRAAAAGGGGEEAQPVPKKAVPARPAARPARRPAPAPVTAGDAEDDGDEASAKGSRRARPGSRGRGGRSRGRSGRSRGRSEGKPKKKASTPMIVGIVGIVLLLAGGGFLFKDDLFGSGDTVDAADNAAEGVGEEAAATDEGVEPEVATPSPEEDAGEDDGEPAAEAPDDVADEAPEEEPEPAKTRDPDSVDLAAIEDFGTVDGTTEEELAELRELLAFSMNPDIGVKQTRSQKNLEEYRRKAFPVILNFMKGLDYSTEQACREGMWAQTMLSNICKGVNYDWREHGVENEPGDRYYEYFNKRVVELWCKSWAQAEKNLTAWKNMAKLTDEEYDALVERLGDDAPEEEPSALDFLGED